MSEKGILFLLKAPATGITATFTNATELVTVAGHTFTAGAPIFLTNAGGALPAELTARQVYYVGNIAGNDFTLHLTKDAGVAGSGTVTFTDDGTGVSTAQALITVAGMRSTGFVINGDEVDVTNKDSGGWRELLEGGGMTSMTITGSGVFQDNSNLADLRVSAANKTLDTYSLTFESGDEYYGLFQVTNVQQDGEFNGEVTYAATLESSGISALITNA